jgi:hypothetical protein
MSKAFSYQPHELGQRWDHRTQRWVTDRPVVDATTFWKRQWQKQRLAGWDRKYAPPKSSGPLAQVVGGLIGLIALAWFLKAVWGFAAPLFWINPLASLLVWVLAFVALVVVGALFCPRGGW